MIQLGRYSGDNYGGFWRLRVAKVAFSAVEIQRNQSVISADLEHLFSDIDFTLESGKYRFDLVQSADGASFTHSISFEVPKFRREVVDWLNLLKNCRFVVLMDTFTSGQIISGDAEHPLKFKARFDGGKEVKNFNHFAFTFEGDSLHAGIPFEDALADFDPNDFEPLDFLTP